MEERELHPTDDRPEPGCYSTLGYLHEQVENYVEKRDKVRAAEAALLSAQRALEEARVDLRYAVSGLSKAIEEAHAKTKAAERILEAPSIELPLPPDVRFEDATPEQDPASSAPRPPSIEEDDVPDRAPGSENPLDYVAF